jgi:hypothetical protein
MRLKFLGAALLLVGSIQSAFAVGIYSACTATTGITACAFSGTGIATVTTGASPSVLWNSDASGNAADKFTFSTLFGNTSLFSTIANGSQENITDLTFLTEPVNTSFGPDPFLSFPLFTVAGTPFFGPACAQFGGGACADLMINFISPGIDPVGNCATAVTTTCTQQLPGPPGTPGPFNLANFNDPNFGLSSTVTFNVSGISRDGSGKWSAIFTSQFLGESYQQVINQLNTTGSVTNSYSQATLVVTSAVPEPASLLMIGSGLIGLAAFLRRRAVK